MTRTPFTYSAGSARRVVALIVLLVARLAVHVVAAVVVAAVVNRLVLVLIRLPSRDFIVCLPGCAI